MKVNLEDLQSVSKILFRHLKQNGFEVIEIHEDYYWNIPKSEKYDPNRDPSDLDLGQLSDDWNELQKILSSQKEPIAYHFVWLAAILRVIGENIVH